MEQLQIREKEIFEALKKIKKRKFVIVGGYAVNAYTLPRFSVDCDIVIKDYDELKKIGGDLSSLGYEKTKNSAETFYGDRFERYEKEIAPNFRVSVDMLIKEIFDRQTNAKFSAEWAFSNSEIRNLRGKTIGEALKVRIINPEALFAMKLICCRQTDIRDVFLLISLIKDKDKNWIKKEVSERYDFKDRLSKLINEIKSKDFKSGLQGVFGLIDEKIFERNQKMILELGDN